MAGVELMPRRQLNSVVSHLPGVKNAIHKQGRKVERRAQRNLAEARASTHWHKIHGPGHLTTVTGEADGVDYLAVLSAPDAMAEEFGHGPSGVFAGTSTKAPRGLYILTDAAGYARKAITPASGRRK